MPDFSLLLSASVSVLGLALIATVAWRGFFQTLLRNPVDVFGSSANRRVLNPAFGTMCLG
ncbi:hypothetical protein [Streptomyces antibioticus]|uniref:hypothetical protein n=1 Tax=Streptomyces antibioticus TaxID=1890 RepID=UPI0019618DBB|nr:hypothetical protein [Streptomyces sp. S9]